MKIPKKITPDCLKDTIVQVVFNPNCAHELILGRFEYALIDVLEFKGSKPTKREIKVSEGKEITIEQLTGGYFVDKTGKVKVSVNPTTIVFNSFNEYMGWENYFPIIQETIKRAFNKGIIESISRIGIRYISQFDQKSVFDNIKMDISIDLPNKDLGKTQFRTEFKTEQFTIIITLLNRLQKKSTDKDDEIQISIFDVDVIQYLDKEKGLKEIIKRIEQGHFQQKASFFSLLKPEFLESLKPEY